MDTIIDYLDNIRDIIFKDVPFNELDALIFSRLSYINYSYVVNKRKLFSKRRLIDVINDLFIEKNPKVSRYRLPEDKKLLDLLRSSLRFKDIYLKSFEHEKDITKVKQFSAITFINKPVGATSTIVTNIYRQNRVAIPKAIASILLCGILSDTLVLKSATTTDEDRETARYLSNITDLDIETLGQEILTASSHIGNRNAAELVHQDMKEYNEGGHSFTVSQIEVNSTDEVLHRKEEFLNELNQERSTRKTLFCALMVTDITRLTSLLLVCADKEFLQVISFPRQEDSIYILKDIVSRKKQLIPLLSEQIEKLNIQ